MLSRNIRETLKYSEYFNFPITLKELHLWLISSKKTPLSKIKSQKIKHPFLINKLNKKRFQRLKISLQKIKTATKFVKLIKFIPTVKMIALTGSLAVNNAKKNDDIDLMIITSPNTLWITRPLIILLTILFFKRRTPKDTSPEDLSSEVVFRPGRTSEVKSLSNTICLNLWLDTLALQVPKSKHNLYTAHEVLQIKPLFNKNDTYQKFIFANSWTKRYLANAYLKKSHSSGKSLLRGVRWASDSSDGGILWSILKVINNLAFKFQYLYMKNKITKETVNLHSAYFHPRDISNKIINRVK